MVTDPMAWASPTMFAFGILVLAIVVIAVADSTQ
jgi:hypothetical protein